MASRLKTKCELPTCDLYVARMGDRCRAHLMDALHNIKRGVAPHDRRYIEMACRLIAEDAS